MKKYTSIILLTTLLGASLSAEANPARAAIAKEIAKREATVAANSARAAYAQQQAAQRSRAMFESIRHNSELNKKNLFIQSEVKKNVALATIAPVVKPTFNKAFTAQANPGIIYRRESAGTYVGQSKHIERYSVRQTEHTRSLKQKFGDAHPTPNFSIIAGAPGGDLRLLRITEETAMRAEKQFGTSLQNKINAMTPENFSQALKGG